MYPDQAMQTAQATAGAALPAPRQSQIDAAMTNLDGLIGEILSRFDVLAQRLEPIVCHQPENPSLSGIDGDGPQLAPLASQIEYQNARLVAFRDRISYFTTVLEV